MIQTEKVRISAPGRQVELWLGKRGCYLENSHDGPEQRVKVLPVWDRVPRLRLDAELAAKDVHPENAARHQHSNTSGRKGTNAHSHSWFGPRKLRGPSRPPRELRGPSRPLREPRVPSRPPWAIPSSIQQLFRTNEHGDKTREETRCYLAPRTKSCYGTRWTSS